MRFCALALCLSAAVFAEGPVAVSDLVGMVTSALAADRDDERIAHTLEPIRLGERLSEATIGMLGQMGAGPATVRQLRVLAAKSRALPPPSEEPIGITPEPSASEREAMVDSMRRHASGYLANLPDFICTREARQFRTKGVTGRLSPAKSGRSTQMIPEVDTRWRAVGSYTAEATYAGGMDHYKLKLVDNKPTTKSFDELRQKVSWGEFAGALKEVFATRPDFDWDRWEVTEGKRSAVFTYYVDPANSGYWLCCPAFTTAHRGFVYADPRSGAVRRIIIYATGLTNNSPVSAAAHVVGYGEVKIGDNLYLLPRSSVAYSRTGAVESREEIDYRDYRKFGADATVAFPAADQPQP
ncbi:MAG: hypothetical protein ABSF98_17705 [Bryobacteraceae bacterium]|jgi:hypothetical protein